MCGTRGGWKERIVRLKIMSSKASLCLDTMLFDHFLGIFFISEVVRNVPFINKFSVSVYTCFISYACSSISG